MAKSKKKNVKIRRRKRKASAPTGDLLRVRALIRDVRARTAAARAELDAACKGADMRSLNRLPVIVGAHKPPGLRRKGRHEIDLESGPVDPLPRPPIAPPVEFDRAAWLEQLDDHPPPKLPPMTLGERWWRRGPGDLRACRSKPIHRSLTPAARSRA